jgi:hypothetical protein
MRTKSSSGVSPFAKGTPPTLQIAAELRAAEVHRWLEENGADRAAAAWGGGFGIYNP